MYQHGLQNQKKGLRTADGHYWNDRLSRRVFLCLASARFQTFAYLKTVKSNYCTYEILAAV